MLSTLLRSCFKPCTWKCQVFAVLGGHLAALICKHTHHALKNRRVRADERWGVCCEIMFFGTRSRYQKPVMGVFMCGWISSRVEYQDQQFPKRHYAMVLCYIIHESMPLLNEVWFPSSTLKLLICIQSVKWDWSVCVCVWVYVTKLSTKSELNLTKLHFGNI